MRSDIRTTDSRATARDARAAKPDELGAHRGVSRITAILEAVARGDGGIRLADLTAHVGAPKTSVYGLVRGLVAVGYLTESKGVYTLGPGLGVLIERMGPGLVKAAALPELQSLVDQTSETALVGVRVGNSVVYLDSVSSPHRVRYVPPLLQRRQLLHTSIGKLYLAQMTTAEVTRLLAEIVPGHPPSELTALLEELEKTKRRGVAMNVNETVGGVSAAAAAIRGREEIIGGISVAGPTDRVLPRLDEIAEQVRAAADRASVSVASSPTPKQAEPQSVVR